MNLSWIKVFNLYAFSPTMTNRSPDTPPTDPFLAAFRGRFVSALRWHDLDRLWAALRAGPLEGWYIYAVGEAPPGEPAAPEDLEAFLQEVDRLLRAEHEEDYCGIVYADDPGAPSFVKIYDPNNLGMVCGSGDTPTLPGWVLSRLPPVDLEAAMPPPGNRRRWWQRIFG